MQKKSAAGDAHGGFMQYFKLFYSFGTSFAFLRAITMSGMRMI